jgi:hypothetical protein
MVSRAHKKLFLNEMVAEREEEGERGEGGKEDGKEDLGDLADDGAGGEGEEACQVEGGGEAGEDPVEEMGKVGSSTALAKDEVARMIRTGVTALFDTNKGDMTDEELDVLLGLREGVVGGGGKGEGGGEGGDEEQERAVAGFWQEVAGEGGLEEVDVRHLEGVNYEKAKHDFDKGLHGGRGGGGGEDSELVELGVRKRKQRLVMVDGRGSGYGRSVPVLADEYARSQKEEAEAEKAAEKAALKAAGGGGGEGEGATGEKEDGTSAGPKRVRREWEHESECFLCQEALVTAGAKPTKKGETFKCGYCPKVFHTPCLAGFTEEEVEGQGAANIMVCPHHNCCGCRRTTAAAGGLLFRCVECPRSFCEDCLEDEQIESLGRWKPLEALGYYTKQAYFIRCPTCLNSGEEEGEGEEGEEEEGEEERGEGQEEEGQGEGGGEDEEGGEEEGGGEEEEEDEEEEEEEE